MQTLDHEPASTLELNSIGVVEIETTRPLFLDPYATQRRTGSFILIDPVSHSTVAAGMVREILTGERSASTVAAIAIANLELLQLLEGALRNSGAEVVRTRSKNRKLIQQLLQIGVFVLIEDEAGTEVSIAHESAVFEPVAALPRDPASAVEFLLNALNRGAA